MFVMDEKVEGISPARSTGGLYSDARDTIAFRECDELLAAIITDKNPSGKTTRLLIPRTPVLPVGCFIISVLDEEVADLVGSIELLNGAPSAGSNNGATGGALDAGSFLLRSVNRAALPQCIDRLGKGGRYGAHNGIPSQPSA